jgi:hypothetical protein
METGERGGNIYCGGVTRADECNSESYTPTMFYGVPSELKVGGIVTRECREMIS